MDSDFSDDREKIIYKMIKQDGLIFLQLKYSREIILRFNKILKT